MADAPTSARRDAAARTALHGPAVASSPTATSTPPTALSAPLSVSIRESAREDRPIRNPPSRSIDRDARSTSHPTRNQTQEAAARAPRASPSVTLSSAFPASAASPWEQEIATFGRVLDDMLTRVSNSQLVRQTAEYLRQYPQHTLRFQIKMKQRALGDAPRRFQSKLMLFYVLHEFLKCFQGEALQHVQREWFQTVDEIIHACVREMKNNEDARKRLFKTLARWEELGIYTSKIKQWKAVVLGESKVRRAPPRLPRTEADRLAEAPDQLQQFPPQSMQQGVQQINRTNYSLLFERSDFRTPFELKQHWRFTAISFIDVLSKCLGLSRDIMLTACMFFHRVFDRGMFAKERYKFAAACIFLSAKASSKRMKLVRMVQTMHSILETPLLGGDEEVLDLERMQLLHYEMAVLQGIDFELTTDLPTYQLRQTLQRMPDKDRRGIENAANAVLDDLFRLPLCLSTRAAFLAQAAVYIACRDENKYFSFQWCREEKDGSLLTERHAKDIRYEHRRLEGWKEEQQRHFDAFLKAIPPAEASSNLLNAFKSQLGGLRLDVNSIADEREYTELGRNDSKEPIGSDSSSTSRRHDESRSEDDRRIQSRDNNNNSRDSSRDRDGRRSDRDSERGLNRQRETTRNRDKNKDMDYDRDDNRGRDRSSRNGDCDRDHDSDKGRRGGSDSSRTRDIIKREPGRDRDRDFDVVKREPGQDWDRDHDHNNGTSRDRTSGSGRDRESDRGRDSNRRDREQDRYRGRGTDQDNGQNRSKDKYVQRGRDRDNTRDRSNSHTRDQTSSRDNSSEYRDRDQNERGRGEKYQQYSNRDQDRGRGKRTQDRADDGGAGRRRDRYKDSHDVHDSGSDHARNSAEYGVPSSRRSRADSDDSNYDSRRSQRSPSADGRNGRDSRRKDRDYDRTKDRLERWHIKEERGRERRTEDRRDRKTTSRHRSRSRSRSVSSHDDRRSRKKRRYDRSSPSSSRSRSRSRSHSRSRSRSRSHSRSSTPRRERGSHSRSRTSKTRHDDSRRRDTCDSTRDTVRIKDEPRIKSEPHV